MEDQTAVIEQINSLVNQAEKTIQQSGRRHLIQIYAEGLKSKLTEADFAVSQLQRLRGLSDKLQTNTAEDATIEDRRYFYSDAFWAFLYSALDVLAHLGNQTLKLGLAENNTDFKKVNTKLQGNQHKDKEVAKLFRCCLSSHDFRRLDKYRNCALHRRHVYVEETFAGISGSRGYTTGETQRVVHYVCDDAYNTKPSVEQKREIPDFMEKMRDNIVKHIVQILRSLTPVK